MSGNSLDQNDFNYQRELSKFLHTECSISTGCRIMIIEKPNLILETCYYTELVGEICNFFLPLCPVFPTFTAYEYLTPLYTTWVYLTQSMLRVKSRTLRWRRDIAVSGRNKNPFAKLYSDLISLIKKITERSDFFDEVSLWWINFSILEN